MSNRDEFETLLQKHRPNLQLKTGMRGYVYYPSTVKMARGTPFGLYLKDFNGRVFAGKVDPGKFFSFYLIKKLGSLCSQAEIRDGDYLAEINGIGVNNKDVAKALILQSLKVNLGSSKDRSLPCSPLKTVQPLRSKEILV